MNVLVTRPDNRGEQLVAMLAERHIFAIHQPLFRVEAGRELLQLPSMLSRLNKGDYVFAVSKNAVDFAVETLKQTGFHWRSDVAYFAVGQSTARHFSEANEQAVRYPIKCENSEGLLELAEMQSLEDKKILVLRANSGREHFFEQARLRGAEVQALECYQRIKLDCREQLGLFKRVGIDTIVATSGEIIANLVEQTLDEDQEWLKSCRLLVIGQRGKIIAQQFGWQSDNIIVSNKADNGTLFKMLIENFN